MLYPNNIGAIGFVRGVRFIGNPMSSLGATITKRGQYTVIPKHSSYPDGYNVGGALVLPYTDGGLSSWQSTVTVDGNGDMISGGPMGGTGELSLVCDGGLSLVVSLAGDGSITVTVSGNLALTISLNGDGSITVIGIGGLSMIVPVEASGGMSLTGSGDLRGRLGMDGSWTPYSELSPENLASAVWSALAAANNNPGTMGDLLNAAGGGGISGAVIDQIADAVWDKVGSNGDGYGDTLTSAEKWAKIAAALSA